LALSDVSSPHEPPFTDDGQSDDGCSITTTITVPDAAVDYSATILGENVSRRLLDLQWETFQEIHRLMQLSLDRIHKYETVAKIPEEYVHGIYHRHIIITESLDVIPSLSYVWNIHQYTTQVGFKNARNWMAHESGVPGKDNRGYSVRTLKDWYEVAFPHLDRVVVAVQEALDNPSVWTAVAPEEVTVLDTANLPAWCSLDSAPAETSEETGDIIPVDDGNFLTRSVKRFTTRLLKPLTRRQGSEATKPQSTEPTQGTDDDEDLTPATPKSSGCSSFVYNHLYTRSSLVRDAAASLGDTIQSWQHQWYNGGLDLEAVRDHQANGEDWEAGTEVAVIEEKVWDPASLEQSEGQW
jgi:hypothetical protein